MILLFAHTGGGVGGRRERERKKFKYSIIPSVLTRMPLSTLHACYVCVKALKMLTMTLPKTVV